jgi:hypothetical protein
LGFGKIKASTSGQQIPKKIPATMPSNPPLGLEMLLDFILPSPPVISNESISFAGISPPIRKNSSSRREAIPTLNSESPNLSTMAMNSYSGLSAMDGDISTSMQQMGHSSVS